MDLTKETIEKIVSMAAPTMLDVDGRRFFSKDVKPVFDPAPVPIHMHTLTGMVKFILKAEMFPADQQYPLVLHVKSYQVVSLLSQVHGAFLQRSNFADADIDDCRFQFGQFMSHEDFMIAAQVHFQQTDGMKDMLKMVGNIKDGIVATVTDDGTTQSMKVKTGITRVEEINVKNPVVLRPYRTFLEVTQPESPFILRIKSGADQGKLPAIALFEADGGRWKLKAMQSIAEHLAFELADMVREKKVVVLA